MIEHGRSAHVVGTGNENGGLMNQIGFRCLLALVATVVPLQMAMAQSTVKYEYDALGRLVAVRNEGGDNDTVSVDYAYDKAGNRINVTVANAPNGNGGGDGAGIPGQKRFVVVPSGTGYALIFLN